MHNRTTQSVLCCCLALLPLAVQAAPPKQAVSATTRQAITEYGQGQYRSALAKFNTTKGKDASSRYYAALCEQNLNMMTDAKADYEWVSTYGKDPLASYSRSALANLGQLQSHAGSSTPSSSSGYHSPYAGKKVFNPDAPSQIEKILTPH
jgi:hypothetical protein